MPINDENENKDLTDNYKLYPHQEEAKLLVASTPSPMYIFDEFGSYALNPNFGSLNVNPFSLLGNESKKRRKQRKINKTKVIHNFFKNNPTWNRLFNFMAVDNEKLLRSEYWNKTIDLIKTNMDITKKELNPREYIEVLEYRHTTEESFLIDLFEDTKEIVKEYKADRFIRNNFKGELNNLVNRRSVELIEYFFENNTNDTVLRKEITSRIYTIKDSDDLNKRLISSLSNSMNWRKDHYKKLAKDMNVEVLKESKKKLRIKIKTFKECQVFAPNSWCIKTSEYEFEKHVNDNSVQIIELNFKKDIFDKDSIKGITLSMNGEITDAHNYENEDIILKLNQKKYENYKFNDDDYLEKMFGGVVFAPFVLMKIYNERKHLFFKAIDLSKNLLKKEDIHYIDHSNFFDYYDKRIKKAKENEDYESLNLIKLAKEITKNTYNKGVYQNGYKILPHLLTTGSIEEICYFLETFKKKIDLPRLVFSTNNEYVTKEMQEMIFKFVKEQIKGDICQ